MKKKHIIKKKKKKNNGLPARFNNLVNKFSLTIPTNETQLT